MKKTRYAVKSDIILKIEIYSIIDRSKSLNNVILVQ